MLRSEKDFEVLEGGKNDINVLLEFLKRFDNNGVTFLVHGGIGYTYFSSNDFPNSFTKHFGLFLVNGSNLSPFPAAKIIAFNFYLTKKNYLKK